MKEDGQRIRVFNCIVLLKCKQVLECAGNLMILKDYIHLSKRYPYDSEPSEPRL